MPPKPGASKINLIRMVKKWRIETKKRVQSRKNRVNSENGVNPKNLSEALEKVKKNILNSLYWKRNF